MLIVMAQSTAKRALEVKYCGECKKFKYEDIDGWGVCSSLQRYSHCSSKCLINETKQLKS